MIFLYWKSAFRNIRKYKLYSFINVTGLAIAVALGILIYLYIQDELSYDHFHTSKDAIYRLEVKQYVFGESPGFPLEKDHSFRFAWMPAGLGPAMKEEIPDIAEFSRYTDDEAVVSYEDKVFNEKVMFVDPGFLKMFDFDLKSGNRNSVMNDIHDLLITPSIVKKYFGNEDPVGKTISLDIWNNKVDCIITGIVRDPPGNSSFKFNILARQELRPWYKESMDEWQSFNSPTFVQLSPHTRVEEFRGSIGKFAEKYYGKYIADERERLKLSDTTKVFELVFNPLTAVHLDKNVSWYEVSDVTYSYILGGIGALIFFIACINFISLSVSGSASRSTEVGIRKVLGAGRISVARQFWGESLGLVIIAVLLGILLASVLIDPFNRFSGKTLSIFSSANLLFFLFIILVTFLTGLFAGGYPSLYLSGFQPVDVLKRKRSARYNLGFTRTLVVFQYALSGILITSSLVMFRQMRFITTYDLGYDKDQVIVIPTYTGWTDDGERLVNNLKNELRGMRGINSLSGTNYSFNRGGWSKNGFNVDGKQHYAYIYRVDPDYVKTLGMEILEGRDFIQGNSNDSYHGIIINEALARDFGWENPVGEHLYWREDSVADEIIGVVRDYHFLSFTEKIEPVILALNPKVSKVMMAMVKISPDDIPSTLGNIEKIWKSQYPDKPFDYSFLDQDVAHQYSTYQRWMKIMGYSTAIAILIACLGLFGLAGISASNRTREISIRKVFGADISSLFIMMNREVVVLGISSFIIATPVSWYFMSRWLNSFVYHIGLSWQIFLAAAVAGILVAVITISYHSIRTALINPAEILKYE